MAEKLIAGEVTSIEGDYEDSVMRTVIRGYDKSHRLQRVQSHPDVRRHDRRRHREEDRHRREVLAEGHRRSRTTPRTSTCRRSRRPIGTSSSNGPTRSASITGLRRSDWYALSLSLPDIRRPSVSGRGASRSVSRKLGSCSISMASNRLSIPSICRVRFRSMRCWLTSSRSTRKSTLSKRSFMRIFEGAYVFQDRAERDVVCHWISRVALLVISSKKMDKCRALKN